MLGCAACATIAVTQQPEQDEDQRLVHLTSNLQIVCLSPFSDAAIYETSVFVCDPW